MNKRVKGDSKVFGLSNRKDGAGRATIFVREAWELGPFVLKWRCLLGTYVARRVGS